MSEQSRKSAEEAAAAKDRVVVYPKANELFIDIDDSVSLAVFDAHIKILDGALGGGLLCKKRPSPSGAQGRWHITVTLPRPVKDAFERILLQCLLGSDRLHEALSWVAASNPENVQHATPTVFFEKPTALPAYEP